MPHATRASETVISVDPHTGRVTDVKSLDGFRSYGNAGVMDAASRAALVLKMRAAAHVMDNAFLVIQGHLTALRISNATPIGVVASVADVIRGKVNDIFGLSIPVLSAPDEVIKSVSSAVKMLENNFRAQMVPKISQVAAGTYAPETWFKQLGIYVEGVQSILGDLDDTSTATLVSETIDDVVADAVRIGGKVAQAAEEVAYKAKAGVESTLSYMPLIVGGAVILIGLLVASNLTAPLRALSGYSPRRRRRRRQLKR